MLWMNGEDSKATLGIHSGKDESRGIEIGGKTLEAATQRCPKMKIPGLGKPSLCPSIKCNESLCIASRDLKRPKQQVRLMPQI